MSLVPNVSYANTNTPVFLLANISSLNVNSISTNSINANAISSVTINSVSSFATYISAADVELSSIYATVLDLDGQVLTANPTELLLNGIPLATTANISSLQDWALDPAISSINADGNDVLNANYLYGSNVSTINVRAQTVFTNNLFANNIFAFSTYTSTISSLAEVADFGYIGQLSTGNAYIGNLSSSTFAANSAEISSIAGNSAFFSTLYTSTISAENLNISSFSATVGNVSSLFISSINNNEINSSSITVNVVGVSSLVANSISSIGAEIRQALMSSIVFSPSLNPSLGGVNVNMGLGGILGNVIGWGAGVFGAAAGTVGLITGITALATGRQTQYINQGNFELVNTQTQLQISTLGTPFSTIYRYVSSINPEQVPGEEIFISTIHPAGGLAIRSFSDPMATLSTPQSTIQSFGQWVSLADTLDVADWALYPAVSTIQGDQAQISSLQVSSIGTEAMNVSSLTAYTIDTASATVNNTLNAFQINSDFASTGTATADTIYNKTISTALILGANDNLFGIGAQGLEIRTEPTGTIWISSPQTNIAGLTNCSTVGAFLHTGRFGNLSSITTSSINIVQQGAFGLSTLMYVSTAQIPGTGTSTCMYVNTDVSLIQNDLYCQQLRVGYANNGGSALTEIAMYAPTVGGTVIGFNVGNSDVTARVQSTLNSGFGGYLLDTSINRPFFSTINQSTAMMSYFPSTIANTIGVSTIAVIPPIQYFGSWYSSTSQTVVGANTQTPITYNSQGVNVGGFTYAGSTITVPVGGTYEILTSIQFNTTSGSQNTVDFWFLKNGTALPWSASRTTVANNAQNLGTCSVYDTAVAGDKYAINFQSTDANMSAGAFPATGNIPGIPSIITNIRRL